jgi:hypothetical protein
MGRKQWFNSHWRCYCQQRVSSCFSLLFFLFKFGYELRT